MMELIDTLKVFTQLADLAQSKGILTLEDAVAVKTAKDVAILKIKELEDIKPLK